jgi:glyoxylase-like metal-dependent hydrolase (beta-lactamase superfamily II)
MSLRKMEIICVEAGPIMTNCYVLADYNKHTALIVDCAFDSAEALFDILNKDNLQLEGVVLTHSHWDHCGDAQAIHTETGADIMIHKQDEYRLLNPNEHVVFQIPWELESAKPNKYLNHLDKIQFGDYEFEIRHTPGHTEGSISLINHELKVVFTGDALFRESIGRTDLPGGNYELLLNSIREQLLTLGADYTVYSGHGSKTTIGYEFEHNPFLNNNLY